MKKIATLSLLIVLATATFGQQADTVKIMTRQDYLSRSKSQKVAGFIFLGIGATCIAIAAPGNSSFDDLAILVLVGAVATIVSIPLFIAAGRNKRRAKTAVAGLQFEKAPYFQNNFVLHSYPAMSIRINL